MKKAYKILLKAVGVAILLPLLYVLIALGLSYLSVNNKTSSDPKTKTVYLNSNGVHLDIVFATKDLDSSLKSGLQYDSDDAYLSLGWGDEGFYLNTPTWGDLTFKTAFNAAFFDSPTLMHLTPYKTVDSNWIKVPVDELSFKKLKTYVANSFKVNEHDEKVLIPNQSYGPRDTFYKAVGNYSLFKTCNTWTNAAFKKSGLKAALWTPFDFGLMHCYQ